MFGKDTYRAGLAAATTAVLSAAFVFPHIAKTAQAQQTEARWDALAHVYLADEAMSELATLRSNWGDLANSAISDAAFAQAETQCLAEAVYYEARSETRSGQKAVAEVVMNRVDSKHFPDTVCGVVYEGSERSTGCQFSFTCDGSMDIAPKGKAWERSQDVAELVMNGGVLPFTGRATHYHTTAIKPNWSDNLRMTKRVGSHVFYRFAPRDYKPSMPTMVTIAPPS